MNTPIDVALFLWNTDVIHLMSWMLQHRNMKSCGVEPSEGADRIKDLIVSCSPSVVIYDVCPPYEVSTLTAMDLQDRFPEISFVITCADSALAMKKAPWLYGRTVFQKPYEMDVMANTVQSMVASARRNFAALTVGA